MSYRIEQRGSSHRIVIEAGRDPSTGQRRRIVRHVRGTKAEAQAIADAILSDLRAGTYMAPVKVTIAEYLREWIDAHRHNLAPSTEASYRMIIERHLIPALGAAEIGDLEPLHIQRYYNDALERLSPRTVQYHHSVLRRALTQAVKLRVIPLNPCDAVTPPKPKPKSVRFLSADEVRRLLETAKDHRDYTLIVTAVQTGMRQGELLGLRWQDLDLEARVIRVSQNLQYVYGQGIVIGEPKTAKGRRQITLPDGLVTEIRSHRKDQAEERLALGPGYEDHDLVFCNPDGNPLKNYNVYHRFAVLARRAGFPGLRFHDLRHTHATLLLSQGVHPKVVQERLGHNSITITLDTYSHVLPGLQEAAAEKIDALLNRNGTCLAPLKQKRP